METVVNFVFLIHYLCAGRNIMIIIICFCIYAQPALTEYYYYYYYYCYYYYCPWTSKNTACFTMSMYIRKK